MTVRASGHAALILAAGLLVWGSGPSQAAAEAGEVAASSKLESSRTSVKHAIRHWRRHGHRKFSRTALKSAVSAKAASTEAAAGDRRNSNALPPAVADANAQLTASDTAAGNASAMSARANDMLQAAPDKPVDAQVVSADQVHDVDHALRESPPPATTMAVATAEASPARIPAAAMFVAGSNESSVWDQASLIGKIFIGFGALLTMASAARMFMA